MEHFFQTQEGLLSEVSMDFVRFLLHEIDFNNRLIGIVGPRGVGKTTLLLQHLKSLDFDQGEALYVSMDDISFSQESLLEFARRFVQENDGKLLILDEVHKYSNWNQELKNIYDQLPNLRVIFSGSSSLDLIKGNYDLSRRAVLYRLPGLSFREYLSFNYGVSQDMVGLDELLSNHVDLSLELQKSCAPIKAFKEYLRFGYYPFFKESKSKDFHRKLQATIEKTIYIDVARFYSLKTSSLPYLSKLLAYLSLIKPGQVSVNKLSQNMGIAYETVSDYLHYLKDSSLLRYLDVDPVGKQYLRNAAKVFLDNSNLVFSMNRALDRDPEMGQIRELFFLNQLQNSGIRPSSSNSCDFQYKNSYFEVGGKTKGWSKKFPKKKNHYLVKDDVLLGDKNVIPLFLFGLLY